MCLVKTHRFPKISRKPIKCYKEVVYRNGNYETWFTMYPFALGDIIKSARHWICGIFCKKLHSEVVHAYLFAFDNTEYMKNYNKCRQYERYIECEIPPFTPYWISDMGDIGAARIKTIKIVE